MTSSKRLAAIAFSVVLALSVAACGGGTAGGTINGAGATFPQPVYSEWANQFKSEYGITVNYQSIGSGGGIAQFTAGTVDFGATDAAMEDAEVKAAEKRGVPVHVPTVFGAVTVSYNLPGVESGLKMPGETIADIYLGRITKWNDPAIVKPNPGVELPDTDITVVHRSDESGTTALFTTFLSDHSKDWEQEIGADKTVKWPTGTGANGNEGVAGAVQQTDGAIGYVEQAYALQNEFTTADVQNAAGNFVAPSLESTSAAGEGLEVPFDLRFSAINSPGGNAYPIASSTFMLVYQDMCEAGVEKSTAENVKAWLEYALGPGQRLAPKLDYAPQPQSIAAQAKKKIDGLECEGGPLDSSVTVSGY